jgi:hypothetical protein
MIKTVFAQELRNPVGPDFTTEGTTFFATLIPNLINLGFVAGVIVFFFVFIIGAIQWMTSGGDKAAVESARGKIANALIGMVVLLLVFVILQVIGNFFGLDIFSSLGFDFDTLRLTR